MLERIHHIAIICSDYEKSKAFYVEVLGLEARNEVYRESRKSMKLDLYLNDNYVVELFSFPESPSRLSYPEACGLRHLAFAVKDLEDVIARLERYRVNFEPIRLDEFTSKRFLFAKDPDGLPIEFYEV
jgi:glyoxylase I family protein